MPELVIRGEMVGGGGGGGGTEIGDDHRRNVVVRTEESAGATFDDLVDQLELQDWVLDAVWEGGSSSGSTWSFDTQDGLRLVGTLSVTPLQGNTVEASFRILNVGLL